MSAVENLYGSTLASNVLPVAIEEHSPLLKAISLIPLIGIIPSFFQEISLAKKIKQSSNVLRVIELINIKNEYKVANVGRNLITAALILNAIGLGIIRASATFLAFVHIGVAGLHIYLINQNKQVVKELQKSGPRPGMRIV